MRKGGLPAVNVMLMLTTMTSVNMKYIQLIEEQQQNIPNFFLIEKTTHATSS